MLITLLIGEQSTIRTKDTTHRRNEFCFEEVNSFQKAKLEENCESP